MLCSLTPSRVYTAQSCTRYNYAGKGYLPRFDDLFHALMAGITVGNRTDDIVKAEVISHTLPVDVFVNN